MKVVNTVSLPAAQAATIALIDGGSLGDFGACPYGLTAREMWGSDEGWVTASHPFTITSVNAAAGYPKRENIGGRPAVSLATASGSADVGDGTQYQVAQATVRLGAGTVYRMQTLLRGSDFATNAWSFGLAALDTTIIASDPTDIIALEKAAAGTQFRVRARKASGTVETVPGNHTAVVADKWYFFDVLFVRGASAGTGTVHYRFGVDIAEGEVASYYETLSVPTQFPDTVDLAPFVAWRVGTAGAQPTGHIALAAWQLR